MTPTVAEVLGMLSDADPSVRVKGALACYESPPPELREPLEGLLDREGDVKVRATLLKALAYVGDVRSSSRILRFLDDPDNRVRANAVEALGLYGEASLIGHFKRMLSDPHNRVRGNAMIALSSFAPERFRESLQRMARSTLPATCLTALYVLSKVDESWAVSLLGQMALRPDNPVPAQTLKTLEFLAGRDVPGAFAALYTARRSATTRIPPERIVVLQPPKVTRRNLARLLEDAAPRVRIFAIQEAAQRMAPEDVVPALLSHVGRETDDHVLATMTKWLGRMAQGRELDVLEPFLVHGDPRVRANTLEGLVGIPSARVCRLAQRLAGDENPRVRAQAARVIARFDPAESFIILRQLILSEDEAEMGAALHALDTLEGAQAVELLEHALLHGGPEVRTRVLNVLSLIEGRVPVARALRQRFESGSFARYEEVYIDELIARLDSIDDEVRLDALRRLRFCRSPKAWDLIEDLAANDRSSTVRELASRFVGACNVERSRRIHYYSLGLRVQQLHGMGLVPHAELEGLCAEVARLDDELAREALGRPLERLVIERRDTVVLLGERAFDVHRRGGLPDPVLGELVAALAGVGEAPAEAEAPLRLDGAPAAP